VNFSELRTADMRLVMLRSMAEDGNSLNESMLQSVLELFGHTVSRDRVRTEMRWLEDQDLIHIDSVAGVLVGRLTGRGADVAAGRCRLDGIKCPRPKG
jgi:hypothetical protein